MPVFGPARMPSIPSDGESYADFMRQRSALEIVSLLTALDAADTPERHDLIGDFMVALQTQVAVDNPDLVAAVVELLADEPSAVLRERLVWTSLPLLGCGYTAVEEIIWNRAIFDPSYHVASEAYDCLINMIEVERVGPTHWDFRTYGLPSRVRYKDAYSWSEQLRHTVLLGQARLRFSLPRKHEDFE